MALVLPADDVVGLPERVRLGDPTVGWRGDPQMDVYFNDKTGNVEVWGFDLKGQRYCAVKESMTKPGFRHEILRKLRDGDWQRPDVVDRVIGQFEAEQASRDRAEQDFKDERAEKLAWAIKKDHGIKEMF